MYNISMYMNKYATINRDENFNIFNLIQLNYFNNQISWPNYMYCSMTKRWDKSTDRKAEVFEVFEVNSLSRQGHLGVHLSASLHRRQPRSGDSHVTRSVQSRLKTSKDLSPTWGVGLSGAGAQKVDLKSVQEGRRLGCGETE